MLNIEAVCLELSGLEKFAYGTYDNMPPLTDLNLLKYFFMGLDMVLEPQFSIPDTLVAFLFNFHTPDLAPIQFSEVEKINQTYR